MMGNIELADRTLEKLKSLTPDEFQQLIVDYLYLRYGKEKVKAGPKRGQDQKVDIVVTDISSTELPSTIVFQCKRYVGTKIDATVINNIQGAMVIESADEGILVSTQEPTKAADIQVKAYENARIKITWRPWCGRNLALKLVDDTPLLLINRFPELRKLFPFSSEYEPLCPSFNIVTPTAYSESTKADKFYSGYPSTWEDLKAKYDINRKVYTGPGGLRARVMNTLREDSGLRVISLVGVACTGKTTLLRRAGFDAAMEGYIVLRLRDDWKCYPRNLAKQIEDVARESQSTVAVLIDDASDLILGGENIFEGMLKELETIPSVLLLLAEQPHRWYPTQRQVPSLIEGQNYSSFSIHRLLLSECEDLVDRIMEYEQDGTLTHIYCNLSRTERLNLCQNIADRQLVVALLQMRHGDRFHKIIEREYERVPMKEAQEAYAAVCYFNTYKIALPLSLLCRSLSVTTAGAVREFQDSTQGLFVANRLGLSARHYVIAKVIANYALPSPEVRKAALATILSSLSFDEEREESIFLQLFSGYNMHRRFVSELSRRSDLVRALYRDIRASHSPYPPYFLKFLATSQALCERLLRDNAAARDLLEEAIGIDNKYVFAYRQFAWLEQDEGKWEKAAERAVYAANLAPTNFLCVYHCGLILSFNTVDNFRRARQYLENALDLAPDNAVVTRRQEQYQAAEKVLEYLSGLRANDFIPEVVFRELRPGLAFLRALHGPRSNDVIRRLESDLRRMEEDCFGEVADLHEKLGDIEIESRHLKALVSCNLARLHYLEWYHQDKPHDPDYMEQLFKHSLELNESDPFTHCWYGTFLKEVRGNYPKALNEYKKARSLGNQSRHLWLHQHPLFLNNVALLIMDEVQKGLRDTDHLQGAKNLLEEAVKRVEETRSDFFWPKSSLSLCLQLIGETVSSKGV